MTPRQRDVMRFLEAYIVNHDGVSPSFDEVAAAIGVRSKSSVSRLLDALEERKFIKRLTGKGRSIEILKWSGGQQLPDPRPPANPNPQSPWWRHP